MGGIVNGMAVGSLKELIYCPLARAAGQRHGRCNRGISME